MDASFKPYLIRAVYEWTADKGFSPYLAVAVDGTCKVPLAYVRNGQIVLDISMEATHQLTLGNESVNFQARFGGAAQHLHIPVDRVMGIFPEHDQQLGAFFEVAAAGADVTGQPAALVSATIDPTEISTQANVPAPLGKPRITRVK